jgi:hypothetical protein
VTEGRRRFLSRYADIERGDECERWAPTLSALVDGEASAEQLAEARPHLRNCPACRATIRTLHEGNRALAALLPLPVLAAAAPQQADAAGGFLARLYELVAGPLHERALLSATKAQAAIEATATGKAAAIAASAAAIAGGGVAVDRTVIHPAPTAKAASAHVKAPARPTPAAPAPRLSARQVSLRSAGGTRRSISAGTSNATASARRHARTTSREFGVAQPGAATASAAGASAAAGTREFEPRAAAAAAGGPAPASGTSDAAAQQAAAEFGG